MCRRDSHTTPQDVKPKEEIDASQIEISVPRQSEIEEEEPMSGRVEYFTASKGYGLSLIHISSRLPLRRRAKVLRRFSSFFELVCVSVFCKVSA